MIKTTSHEIMPHKLITEHQLGMKTFMNYVNATKWTHDLNKHATE